MNLPFVGAMLLKMIIIIVKDVSHFKIMKDCAMNQFGFIIALNQTNTFLAYNYF